MTQANPILGAGKTGLQYRTDDNSGKQALLNHHKGGTAPSYAEAGMIWLDDAATPWRLKIYDGADWMTLGEVHAGNDTVTPYYGTGGPRLLNHAMDIGAANAYVLAPSPAISSYTAGQVVTLKPAHVNTGGSTLNVNALGARTIRMTDGSVLPAGAMVVSGTYILVYDGTDFILLNPTTAVKAAGTVISSAADNYTSYATLTAVIPEDDTIPQNSEGTQILSITLNAEDAADIIEIDFSAFYTISTNGFRCIAALFQGTNCVHVSSSTGPYLNNFPDDMSFCYRQTAGTTGKITFTLRIGPHAGTLYLNGNSAGRLYGGQAKAVLRGKVIKA